MRYESCNFDFRSVYRKKFQIMFFYLEARYNSVSATALYLSMPALCLSLPNCFSPGLSEETGNKGTLFKGETLVLPGFEPSTIWS